MYEAGVSCSVKSAEMEAMVDMIGRNQVGVLGLRKGSKPQLEGSKVKFGVETDAHDDA